MKKVTLLILGLITFSSLSYAQNKNEETSVTNDKYRVITNMFGSNWFITAGAGPQILFGDQDSEGKFVKRISPALNVGIGKWFTPGLGLRLQYSGLSVKGFGGEDGGFIKGTPDVHGFYKEKWNYMNLHGDAMFNLTNMLCGYKEDRFYNAIPYAGFGLIYNFDKNVENQKNFYFGVNVGIVNKFRLSRGWDFNIEANALMMRDDFDSKMGGAKMDAVISLSAGFTYNFKQRGFKKAVLVNDNTDITSAEMDAIREKLNEAQAKNQELEKQLEEVKNQEPEKVEEPASILEPAPRTIFFRINKAIITPKEKVNIQYIADQIKQNPNKVFTVTGYADSSTGTAEFNQKLSLKRAENVYNMLVNDFNVNPDQLKVEGKGGVPDMFDSAILTRVVIVK